MNRRAAVLGVTAWLSLLTLLAGCDIDTKIEPELNMPGGTTGASGGGDDESSAITYPVDGDRPNVLARGVSKFESNLTYPSLGFVAKVPANMQLKIRITRVSPTQTTDAFQDVWTYAGVSGLNWTITQWDGSGVGPQEFTSAREGVIDLEEFNFLGTGSALFEYFENGSTTPSYTKMVKWLPSGGGGETPCATPGSCPGIDDCTDSPCPGPGDGGMNDGGTSEGTNHGGTNDGGTYDDGGSEAPKEPLSGSLSVTTHLPEAYLLDDFEDGDGTVIQYQPAGYSPAWSGHWYDLHADRYVKPEKVINGRGGHAVHFVGSGTEIANGFGVDLENSSAVQAVLACDPVEPMSCVAPVPSELIGKRRRSSHPNSGSTGVAFWARSGSSMGTMRFSVLTTATVTKVEGGDCTSGCGQHFYRDFNVGDVWRQYSVPFALRNIVALEFGTEEPTLDLWIDDIGFYRCSGDECDACDDGIKNGGETALDCGGTECGPCGITASCNDDSDCWEICSGHMCTEV